MVCFIERRCQFAKIIPMVDERNNGTEHSLNGTDGITKVLGGRTCTSVNLSTDISA